MAVRVVELDKVSRKQQVNDGCFDQLDDVPKRALTLTIPQLMKPKYVFCAVPGNNKQQAVDLTINGEIAKSCPASVLRLKQDAKLFLDSDSGASFL